MFEECNNLAELNAARIKAANESTDLVALNNAYNKRRQEILSEKKNYVQLKPIPFKTREVLQYCGIPVAGRSPEPGTIVLTEKGFLY